MGQEFFSESPGKTPRKKPPGKNPQEKTPRKKPPGKNPQEKTHSPIRF